MRKFRLWVIRLLAGRSPVMLKCRFVGGTLQLGSPAEMFFVTGNVFETTTAQSDPAA